MRKQLLNRQRRALRWCAAAAVLLAAAWVLLPRNLTLAMAHRRAMEDILAAPAETLYQTRVPLEKSYEEWLVLAQSEDTVCMGNYQKAGWLNWRCSYVLTVDREEGRPFAAGHYYKRDRVPGLLEADDEPNSRYDYFFGCVWDPAAETLEICLRLEDAGEQWYEQLVRLDTVDLETDSRGERWFFVTLGPETRKMYSYYGSVTAYDGQGNSLGTQLVAGMPRWLDE